MEDVRLPVWELVAMNKSLPFLSIATSAHNLADRLTRALPDLVSLEKLTRPWKHLFIGKSCRTSTLPLVFPDDWHPAGAKNAQSRTKDAGGLSDACDRAVIRTGGECEPLFDDGAHETAKIQCQTGFAIGHFLRNQAMANEPLNHGCISYWQSGPPTVRTFFREVLQLEFGARLDQKYIFQGPFPLFVRRWLIGWLRGFSVSKQQTPAIQ